MVEDNDEVRRSTYDLLDSWGYSVTPVADGHQAVAVFGTEGAAFDLLITDVLMDYLAKEPKLRSRPEGRITRR